MPVIFLIQKRKCSCSPYAFLSHLNDIAAKPLLCACTGFYILPLYAYS